MIKKSIGLFSVLSIILALCSCAPTTINTIPPGAVVYGADGQTQLGTTPFDAKIFVNEKNFTIRKDRYFDESVKLDFDSPRGVVLKLRARPVLVDSIPGAGIYPAGSETSIGSTPMKMTVGDKESTYTLKAKGYYDQDIAINLETADPLVITLARRPIVTLSAAPEGVEVYEDGKLIGPAPVQEEILTSRTFELRKANYFTKTVTLKGAPPYEVAAELKPFPVITVAATPSGAQISRAGSLIGKDSVKLAVGEKIMLDVRADRYYAQSITLTPESPAKVNVMLKAMPYVMISSQPAGAEVFIAGKSIGQAPVERLVEKDTVIELRKEGFVTKTATLTGADKQVTVTLEAVPPPVVTETEKPVVAEPVKAPAPQNTGRGKLLIWVGIGIVAAGLIVFSLRKLKK